MACERWCRDDIGSGPVRTLGIDLAPQPAKTGVAVIDWSPGEAEITELTVGADDDRILELASKVDALGIDSPFGWPLRLLSTLAD